jgi:hypothetical protein
MTNSYFWYVTYSHSQLIPIVCIYIHTYAYIYILSINTSILCLFLLQRLRGHRQDILTLSDLSASERLKELLQKAVSKRVSAPKLKRDSKEIGCMDISTHFWYLLILFVPVGVFKDRTAGYWLKCCVFEIQLPADCSKAWKEKRSASRQWTQGSPKVTLKLQSRAALWELGIQLVCTT